MDLLLTSGGITNPTIHDRLVTMLGRPVGESRALCIPTAQWGHPMCGPQSVRGFVAGAAPWGSMTALGWASLGVLELTALPSVPETRWRAWLSEADVLLVDGGEATYLAHHLRASGVADLMPSLDCLWVGVSAGSMVMTPRIGDAFREWPGAADDSTLGLVGFSIFPHLGVFPENSLDDAREWAAGIDGPAYALDDDSAIAVTGGRVEVVSEGTWERLR